MENENFYDVIILGKGPSGLSCAIYTQRANLSTLIIGKNDGNLSKAKIENYFGISEKVDGKILIENTEKNLLNLGAKFIDDYVVEIENKNTFFSVTTKSKLRFSCKYLVFAFGVNYNRKYNFNVSYCAVCDGFFYKNKVVAVKGNTEKTLNDAIYLSKICKKVYVLTDGENQNFLLNEDVSNIEVITNKIVNIIAIDNQPNVVKFENDSIEISGLFISENVSINSVQSLCIITKNNFIKVNENKMTNIKNIYAIGDICGYPHQVAKAVYDGMICGLDIIKGSFFEKK